jgi:hypothetical protein
MRTTKTTVRDPISVSQRIVIVFPLIGGSHEIKIIHNFLLMDEYQPDLPGCFGSSQPLSGFPQGSAAVIVR